MAGARMKTTMTESAEMAKTVTRRRRVDNGQRLLIDDDDVLVESFAN